MSLLAKPEQRAAFLARLEKANATQASIETLSKFFCVYRREAATAVSLWEDDFTRAPPDRKLALVYLANHVLQESRKKGPEFVNEFHRVLPAAFRALTRGADDKMRRSVTRLVSVWDERKIFGSAHIRLFKQAVGMPLDAPSGGAAPSSSGAGGAAGLPPAEAAKLAAVGPLADALAEAAALAERSAQWAAKSRGAFRPVRWAVTVHGHG